MHIKLHVPYNVSSKNTQKQMFNVDKQISKSNLLLRDIYIITKGVLFSRNEQSNISVLLINIISCIFTNLNALEVSIRINYSRKDAYKYINISIKCFSKY